MIELLFSPLFEGESLEKIAKTMAVFVALAFVSFAGIIIGRAIKSFTKRDNMVLGTSEALLFISIVVIAAFLLSNVVYLILL